MKKSLTIENIVITIFIIGILSVLYYFYGHRWISNWARDVKSGNCTVKQYSGGSLIRQWKFNGVVNNSSKSDGYYFYCNDSLFEISGDVQISYP